MPFLSTPASADPGRPRLSPPATPDRPIRSIANRYSPELATPATPTRSSRGAPLQNLSALAYARLACRAHCSPFKSGPLRFFPCLPRRPSQSGPLLVISRRTIPATPEHSLTEQSSTVLTAPAIPEQSPPFLTSASCDAPDHDKPANADHTLSRQYELRHSKPAEPFRYVSASGCRDFALATVCFMAAKTADNSFSSAYFFWKRRISSSASVSSSARRLGSRMTAVISE